MKNNDIEEERIYLSFFEEKISEGEISFLVLDSKYNTIHSKKKGKDFEVVEVTVEAKELDNPDSKKETITVNIFIDSQPRGFFHQFVVAALEGTQATSFVPRNIIGLRGEGDLHYYQGPGSKKSYPQVTNFIFFAQSSRVNDALSKYTDIEEGFDLEKEDFDFEGPKDNLKDENNHDHKGVE